MKLRTRTELSLGGQVAQLEAENEKFREVLEWYADEGNYTSDDAGCEIAGAWQRNMLGYKARKALGRNHEDLK